jgi:Flp pilus assembly protein TadG
MSEAERTARASSRGWVQLRRLRWMAARLRLVRPNSAVREQRPDVFSEAGTALVEFAISASVLLMLVFGIIEMSYALYAYNYVSDAARVATRYAVVRGSSCSGMPDCGITATQLQTYVQGIAYPGIKPGSLTATTTWLSASSSQPTTWTVCAGQCNSPGNAVEIQMTYAFPLFLPFWKSTSLSLKSTSQMVISN